MNTRYTLILTMVDGSELLHKRSFRNLKSVMEMARRAMRSPILDIQGFTIKEH